jgi:hypothetical protein
LTSKLPSTIVYLSVCLATHQMSGSLLLL